MDTLILLTTFSILLLVPGSQSIFADTMVIGPGSQVIVESGSTLEIDSDDAPNTLTNKGDLVVEDGGNVIITKEANFFNDCDATVSLDGNNAMQIGSIGALLATLTNHGSIFGPGEINFIASTIEVKNSDILTAVLNPAVAIMQIASICSVDGGTQIGGVLIPIDASALILAGAQTGMIWILPAIVIAGISIVLIKSKRSVKVNA